MRELLGFSTVLFFDFMDSDTENRRIKHTLFSDYGLASSLVNILGSAGYLRRR